MKSRKARVQGVEIPKNLAVFKKFTMIPSEKCIELEDKYNAKK